MTDVDDVAQAAEVPMRTKVIGLCVGALVLVGAGLGYLAWASGRSDEDIAAREARAQAEVDAFEPSATEADAETPIEEPVLDGPTLQPGEVLVVHRVPGDDYGRMAIRHQDGTRTLLDRKCLRVHAAGGSGVCLGQDEAVLVPAFRTEFFDASAPGQPEIRSYSSPLPSRARVSPDGSLVTTTAFVTGSSYADIGGEAETIVIVDRPERGDLVGMLQFEVLGADDRYNAADRQFWGLSWDGPDDFWITGFFGDEPEILTGNLSRRTLERTGIVGSCPSLAPDGEHLVFKDRQADGSFALVVRNVATGDQWPLGETRSVDDQVEWLDNDTILYALHPDGTSGSDVQPQFDIWSVDIAPDAEPELFLPAADSPAVIRG